MEFGQNLPVVIHLQNRMEATFGPTFSPVAPVAKGKPIRLMISSELCGSVIKESS